VTGVSPSPSARPDIGIFARVFPVQPARTLARTARDLGFSCVQLNLVAVGHSTVPTQDELAAIDLTAIGRDFAAEDVSIWGLSATYNMAHPDPAIRAGLSHRAAAMIARAPELGATAVSLCTGTRDPDDQWRAHPDNTTANAWNDMLESFDVLLTAASAAGVRLAVEPEPANIIRDTDAAYRLIQELGDKGAPVGFILDPANLVAGADPTEYPHILDDAFTRLGPRTVCVHAKDVVTWHDRLAGAPGLDFDHIARLHAGLPSPVPIIIQDTEPDEAAAARDLLLAAGRAESNSLARGR